MYLPESVVSLPPATETVPATLAWLYGGGWSSRYGMMYRSGPFLRARQKFLVKWVTITIYFAASVITKIETTVVHCSKFSLLGIISNV